MKQITLDLKPLTVVKVKGPLSERFEAFHEANPHVYESLWKLIRILREKNRDRYGMKGLFEVLRWEYALNTTEDEFKLNNNFTSFYSRIANAQLGFKMFEERSAAGDDWLEGYLAETQ